MIPVASDPLEIDLDTRLHLAWEMLTPGVAGRFDVMAALLRYAYGQGYWDALVEPVRGELCAAHGFTVPARPALDPTPRPQVEP